MNKKSSIPASPLQGIRILDLTSVIMGPYATHILADMGADVIKIEGPEGDLLRNYLPMRNPGMSGNILNLHRNKRAVQLDLKSAAACAAFDRLIATADVFVHNIRPKAIARLGYAYERVRSLKADIVYCSAQGFGVAGPYGDKAAYDDLIQAGSGVAGMFDQIWGEPRYVPTVVCDKIAGQAIVYAILGALLHRERGGGGQAVEVPMFETMVEFNFVEHMCGFGFDPPLGDPGFARVMQQSRKPYRTRDGYACILPYSDRNWLDFYEFTGRREFLGDARFDRLPQRVQNISVLYAMLEQEAPKRTNIEWVEFCDRVSIPCMPVLRLKDLPDDPHLRAVGMFGLAEHPTEGAYRSMKSPISFGNAPFSIRRHAPRQGENTREVLMEAGLGASEIDELTAAPATAR